MPLLEIVSEPDMRSGKDAYAYGDELRRIVRFLGISDANMAEGSMRCDVNISLRPWGREQFGTKVGAGLCARCSISGSRQHGSRYDVTDSGRAQNHSVDVWGASFGNCA